MTLPLRHPKTRSAFLAEPWTLVCVFLGCAGWLLSAIHQLNAAGYAIALALGGLALWWKRDRIDFGRVRIRRFRKAFPASFLFFVVVILFSGLWYAPNNYDGMAYRTSRVLHWLSEGRWHWIHTSFPRLNIRSCGFEWLTAPMIALTRSDRLLFLLNVISFIQLPGLIFSLFTKMGVRARVAWHWMWVAPTGYCFLLQAGGIGNDLIGVPLALAAADFGLRARESRQPWHLWLCILATGVLTNMKASNLLLGLFPFLLVLQSLSVLKHRKLATCGVMAVALLSSFLPLAVINSMEVGDWTGKNIEKLARATSPVFQIIGNSATVALSNMTPPVFPFASAWNNRILPSLMSAPILNTPALESDTKELNGSLAAVVPELAMEEGAPLGFGLAVLLSVSLLCGGRFQIRGKKALDVVVMASPYFSLFLFLALAFFAHGLGRILAPFYLLLLPLILLGRNQERLTRTRWWRTTAWCVIVLALCPLVLLPSRPLWPAKTIITWLRDRVPENALIARAERVYSVYGNRADAFGQVTSHLPAGVENLGFMTYDDPESSLWKPFGSRQIEHILQSDSRDYWRTHQISLTLVSDRFFNSSADFEKWLSGIRGESIRSFTFATRASEGPISWHLVRLLP